MNGPNTPSQPAMPLSGATLPLSHTTSRPGLPWLPVLAGLLALYGPTVADLATTLWETEDHAHGPIVLAVSLWLAWKALPALFALESPGRPAAGWPLLVFGLFLYVLGRSQTILIFEVGSALPVIAGALLIQRGWPAFRLLRFPVLFLFFLVPLPGVLVDALTGPLKQYVSVVAENLLYWAGYPIGRSGVTLVVGQYHLLVADACSGLNSMFSLSALGLLYLHLMRYPQWWRNGLLLASILPIAFVANIVRVAILVLVTYHFGDEAGQGFVHGFAGMVLFVAAVLLLMGLDGAIGLVSRLGRRRTT